MLSGMLAEACSGLRTLDAFNEVRAFASAPSGVSWSSRQLSNSMVHLPNLQSHACTWEWLCIPGWICEDWMDM